jgi:SulP family sulfate permease
MKPLSYLISRPFRPLVEDVRGYHRGKFRDDLLAGITVAVVAVPQSMAFALLAEVDPVYGLYTAMIQAVISSLFNSSKHVAVGPTNTQSLLIASVATRLAASGDGQTFIAIASMLAMLKGLIQLAMAVARLGHMVKYVSLGVMHGFTAGAAVLIAAAQVPNFLGLPPYTGTRARSGLIDAVNRSLAGIDQVHWPSVLIGVGCLIVIVAARKLSRFVPGPLLAIVLAAVAVYFTGWAIGDPRLIGSVPQSLPSFVVPLFGYAGGSHALGWSTVELMLVPAVAIAVLGLLEQAAIGKAIATKTGQRINDHQECFSQGLTNFVSSFFQCFCGSASFSRSALNYAAGARTRFASTITGLGVGAMLLLLGPLAEYIPKASLAAVLFVVAYGLIEFKAIMRVLRTSRADAATCAATFFATLLLPLEYAIYVGIALNIGLYLHHASRLQIAEMVPSASGPFQEMPVRIEGAHQAVVFLQLEGNLFFGVADELQDRLIEVAQRVPRVVIFRLKRTHSLDSTVLAVLDQFTRDMHTHHSHVILCGVKPELMETLSAFGLADTIGRDNVFETSFGVFTSAKRALDRAKHLIGESIDVEGLDHEGELEGWAFEI